MAKNLNFCMAQHNSYYLMKKYMPELLANSDEANPVMNINDVL